jgi:DNA-binding transcriptional ArsR family regulator
MVQGIGRALARAVLQEGLGEDLAIEGPSLANARRRLLFRYLCLRPCARVGDIVRDLSMSQATVRWHAWDLLENGYVQVEGTRVFPSGLIDPEDAGLFASLASAGRAAVLAVTAASPGMSYQEVARKVGLTRQSVSKIAQELSAYSLLSLVEDGRYRRLYLTNRLALRRETNRLRAEAFGDALLRRLADDGLTPELLRRDEAALLVRFGVGSQRVVLDVPLDPYRTAWQGAI